jgi:hypothetical protein
MAKTSGSSALLVKRKLARFKVTTATSNKMDQRVTKCLLLGLQMPFCPVFTKRDTALKIPVMGDA